jgi:hypothetical protein
MEASEMQAIGDTLMRVVTPDMTPKQLIKAARKEHPNALKKDIARAAFFSIIANADQDIGKSKNLQAFAIAERIGEDEVRVEEIRLKPKKR